MQSMPNMRVNYRWLLCSLLCFASGVSTRAAEVLIYDGTFTTTAGDHGFAYFHASPASGMDWLAPADLYEGQWHIRYEVLDYPSDKPFQLSVCIWADVGARRRQVEDLARDLRPPDADLGQRRLHRCLLAG